MESWGSLTCGRLLEMAETVQAKIKEGKENNGSGGLQFEKLTHGFWRAYIRREVLRAGGEAQRTVTKTSAGTDNLFFLEQNDRTDGC